MKWCMVGNASTGAAQDWLRFQSEMRGASHDGVNTVYGCVPPVELLTDVFTLPADIDLPALIVTVGQFLAARSNTVLVAAPHQFKLLYDTPHHRLWCGLYLDWQSLEADYIQVFGVGVDGRKPLETLKAEASEAVRQLITAAP